MRTKNILIVMAALVLCCLASSCAKQKDFDSFKEETDSHLGTVEGQTAYLGELAATLAAEQTALKVYSAALGVDFEEYAAEVDSLADVLDLRLDAVEAVIPTLVGKSYAEATFATLSMVDSLGDVAAAIAVKVQNDSTALADSIKSKTAASEEKLTAMFASYYTRDVIDGKINILKEKLDTLSSYMDTAVLAHIAVLKTDVQQLGTDSKELADKLDEEVAALKNQDTVLINQITALDTKYLGGLKSLAESVRADSIRLVALEDRVTKLETGVQSVRVVPGYSDGKVDIKKGDTEIKFDVRPVSAAQALVAKGTSVFSFQIVEALVSTKASIYTGITIDTVFISGADSLLVVTVDGTTMPAEFFEETKFYNARLRIHDGVSDCSSSYFPLSPVVETANCYIVSAAGTYKFKAVKGNSSESIGDVKGVKVLWESDGTAISPGVGGIIKADVKYENGYITYSTNDTFKEGNAVIAAYSDAGCTDGNVLWSWHIWCTDQPAEQEYNNEAGTMMDRNLGATSADKGQVSALGLLYQWGRKDPFLSGESISSTTVAASTGTWSTVTVQDNSSDKEANLRNSIKNPTTYITNNDENLRDWYCTSSSNRNDSLWKVSTGKKTIYDPCPVGYRVPNGGKKSVGGVWAKAFDEDEGFMESTAFANGYDFGATGHKLVSSGTCWYPAAGYRISADGRLADVGAGFYFWSCTSSSYNSYNLGFISIMEVNFVAPSSDNGRAYGLSVRCLKE